VGGNRAARRVRQALSSLSAQLLIAFVVATLLPIVVSLVEVGQDRSQQLAQATDSANRAAELSAAQVSDLYDELKAIAATIDGTESFWAGDDTDRDRQLALLSRMRPYLTALAFATPDLQEHGSSFRPGPTHADFSSRQYARDALASGQIQPSDRPLTGLQTGTSVLPIAVPLAPDGQPSPAGLLMVALNVDRLPSVWEDMPLPSDSTVMLVDLRTDAILAASGSGATPVGKALDPNGLAELATGSGRSITADDLGVPPRLRAAATVGDGPWLTVVDIPQTTILAPVQLEANRRLATAIGMGGLGLLLLFFLWQRLARWVARMELAAARWAQGDWQHRAGMRGPDEFSRLSIDFDRMAGERQIAETALVDTKERLQRTASELAAVLRAATEFAIIGVNLRGHIMFFNEGAERMLGYQADEVIGRSPLMFHDPAEVSAQAEKLGVSALRVFVHAASHGGSETREWTFIRKDRTRFIGSLTMSAMHADDGELIGFTGIALDVTERKAVDRMKDEFISIVSHELRTPLTGLRASMGLLAEGLLGPLPPRGQRMVDIAVSNTDRLVRLVNDLLDLERMQSGHSQPEMIDAELGALILQAADTMRSAADQTGICLLVDPTSARVRANPDQVVQVLTNLLSNAIKFSPSGTTIALSAAVDATRRQARIEVRDEGRGIPEDQLEHIFERFWQGDASDSRAKGGTGLGLAITRLIVEQHHGRIWAESEVGHGSTFIVELPLSASQGATTSAA